MRKTLKTQTVPLRFIYNVTHTDTYKGTQARLYKCANPIPALRSGS